MGIELELGNSDPVISFIQKNSEQTFDVEWANLNWFCPAAALPKSYGLVDFAAVNLNVDTFDLRKTSAQNLTFSAVMGLASTSSSGELALKSIVANPNFKYGLYLSVDDYWSDGDIEIVMSETERNLVILEENRLLY